MRRSLTTLAAVLATMSLVTGSGWAGATGTAVLRVHRLIMPVPPLPDSLTVDEAEYSVTPSESVVAAGRVTFTAYDRGQDEHNLTVSGPVTANGDGQIRGQVWMQSGGSATIVAHLPPGRYKLYCSMFAGTSMSHEKLGMLAYIIAR